MLSGLWSQKRVVSRKDQNSYYSGSTGREQNVPGKVGMRQPQVVKGQAWVVPFQRPVVPKGALTRPRP